MRCTAKIRPVPDNPATEVSCEHDHSTLNMHRGVLRDFAHPGSETVIEWLVGDRREFYGDWPGLCGRNGYCRLPAGHPRECNHA